ncbi:MAG: NADH-quinone oxidoreductase subunit B family protein [Anaerolineaceae bacterium]
MAEEKINTQEQNTVPRFAVLQLSGCAGCEVSLLNAHEWTEKFQLTYMPLVSSAYDVPEVDILLISGGVRTDEDAHHLKNAVKNAKRVVAVGTCAISGGVANLGNRDEVRQLFLKRQDRLDVPRLLPRSRPVDDFVSIDLYLPGCPPTPELFMAALTDPAGYQASLIVCQECGRKKLKDQKPEHLLGIQKGNVDPEICLINQGYACIGTSTRGGCRAPCTRAGHPCVGCRGPSNLLIEKDSQVWLESIQKVFHGMTNIPDDELKEALLSPQLALFLFQFSDYAGGDRPPRPKEKVL